ncbi:MAG: hypothetical protein WC102_06900 [Saccharofermentanales bacterium]
MTVTVKIEWTGRMLMWLDNELVEVVNYHDNGYGGYNMDCDNGCEYNVFPDRETAEKATSDYWRNMWENDKEEFKCLVGEKNLVAWAMGECAGPGTFKCCSLEEWFDCTEDCPEELWAPYDGDEIEGVEFNKHFENATGFDDRKHIVLYRHS